ncbi:SRPBCC family protein [Pseudoxanthomonas sp. PXM02]|uniref:SRPBCC family protein n=1 Tax=Pseudoxanthomonas sp. PXM02 TaxID=2769294 RepID=UPI00177EC7CF|nr:SRPBCC family protein [Pseudoxanthomonas sp. PXM02]MBD9477627.1 SRPBCC family protein [Pseudoxanthomonas sp. PXM02]
MSSASAPVARTQMLIRAPAATVFEAFVDPAVTSRFWFTRASAPLQAGADVVWYWDMYGAEGQVHVEALERPHRLRITWPNPVEWRFDDRGDGTTLVTIEASGFTGDPDARVRDALDQQEGFALVLAGCKAFLEHGIALGLVADHAPDAHVGTPSPKSPS